MGSYTIRINSGSGDQAVEIALERSDDIEALNAALEICRQQTVEVWEGSRQIGAVTMSGTPRLTL